MRRRMLQSAMMGGPFRLVKYFIVSGFALIAVATLLLGALLYSRSADTVLRGAENYARLLADNLNYNIYNGFYAPLRAQGIEMDLGKWDQFTALDSLVKDFTYGLKIQRIKIVGRQRTIDYSTDYDLIGKFEPGSDTLGKALEGKAFTVVRHEKTSAALWRGKWLAETYYPLREVTGNYWMLGKIYGVLQITQDVSDQYAAFQRSVMVIMLVAAVLMAFLFAALTLIVRRGENILLERAREQNLLEEQLRQTEKMASIGQMVATIAHEIRNPLGIIRSSADVLHKQDNPAPERRRKLAGVIVEEATRLSAILTDFLDFARPRPPDKRVIDVRDVIDRVKNNLEQEIQSRQVQWRQTVVNGGAPLVAGDSDLLYQAFLNVAMNAFEAMDDGGTFSVTIDPDDSRIRIDFADDGRGIKEEDLRRIFTPFFTTSEMGTGLGLSVVHNIITAHGGEISVKSSEGNGAVFTVMLPARSDDEGSSAPASGGAA